MSAKHTPTPWELEFSDFGEGRTFVLRHGPKKVILAMQGRTDSDEHNANAAFILAAVNSHETYQRIFDALKRWTDHGNMPKYDSLMADGDETFGEAIDDAIVKFRAVKP